MTPSAGPEFEALVQSYMASGRSRAEAEAMARQSLMAMAPPLQTFNVPNPAPAPRPMPQVVNTQAAQTPATPAAPAETENFFGSPEMQALGMMQNMATGMQQEGAEAQRLAEQELRQLHPGILAGRQMSRQPVSGLMSFKPIRPIGLMG